MCAVNGKHGVGVAWWKGAKMQKGGKDYGRAIYLTQKFPNKKYEKISK